MKKRIGIRIGTLLMAMLFVVSLSGCGKPWEKQVKLTDLKLEYLEDIYVSRVVGNIQNITDKDMSQIYLTIEYMLEDGGSKEVVESGISGCSVGQKREFWSTFSSKKAKKFKIINVEIIYGERIQ